MTDFQNQVFIDECEDILKHAGTSHTAGKYPIVALHTKLTNWRNLTTEIMSHYLKSAPWLPSLTVLEVYSDALSEGQDHDTEWSQWYESLAVDQRSYTLSYLDVVADYYYLCSLISQLDKNNTIDTPIPQALLGFESLQFRDERYHPEFRKSVKNFLDSVGTQKLYRVKHGCARAPAAKDEVSNMLVKGVYASRRTDYIQRLENAVDLANRNGWFMVFDTITLADDKVDAFYENKTALRDYFRTIGRMVADADLDEQSGRSLRPRSVLSLDRHARDCFSYFCVPEYGSEKGRLHFHALIFMRTLPRKGQRDPNFGLSAAFRKRTCVNGLNGLWEYGYNLPVAVRYSGDAYGRKHRWLNPLGPNGKPRVQKGAGAIAGYVSKYVCKQVDETISSKGLNGKESCQTTTAQWIRLNRKHFRIRMSRGFGLSMPPMEHLTTHALLQMCNLSFNVCKRNKLVRHNARKTLKLRMAMLSIESLLDIKPETTNLLVSLRHMMKANAEFNPVNFINIIAPALNASDVSDEVTNWIAENKLRPIDYAPRADNSYAGK